MTSQDKHHPNSPRDSKYLLLLTALGIVYGDIGTSPLYALREAFHGPHGIALTQQNIFGVLSLILWTLLFIISFKYLQFVLRADNKGEGGVLALTALAVLQKNKDIFGKKFFLYLGLFGATLMVGDSLITPSISVLSAVEGLKYAAPKLEPYVLLITFVILILLFYIQHKGTAKIGQYFGPIMLIWFATISVLGLFSIIETPEILYAANPLTAFQFWLDNPKIAFIAMSAVFLVTTGGEALYADMGHLGREPIFNGWFFVALPGLLLNYFGQGALLLRTPEAASNPFYLLAPDFFQIPLVIIATCATIIASQAVISGFFSLASQCVQLGYAPRIQIVHTSDEETGQIYVPAINWIGLLGTLWLVAEFKNSSSLAAAYGISVSMTMVITTILTAIVAWHTWKWSLPKLIPLFLCFFLVEIIFLGANLTKIADGGWVPLVISVFVFTLATTWKKGRTILYERLKSKSYPFESLLIDLKEFKPTRVPGCAVFMVGDVSLTPPALLHNLKHNKVLHETVVFLTVIGVEVPYVSEADKIQVDKLADGFYRITANYGFSERPDILTILNKAEALKPGLKIIEPTFFLGREILVAGSGVEMPFWRKILFAVMARNATTANDYFKLPLDRVVEVGMQIDL
jgi:KUP system potassium uptake protein